MLLMVLGASRLLEEVTVALHNQCCLNALDGAGCFPTMGKSRGEKDDGVSMHLMVLGAS